MTGRPSNSTAAALVRGFVDRSRDLADAERPAFAHPVEIDAGVDGALIDNVVAEMTALGIAADTLVLSVPSLPGYDDGLALALARRLVVFGRVVLVAGDAGTVTPLAGALGIADLIKGEASFADVIHRDRNSRLHIIPAGRTSRTDMDDLVSVIDALKETYDIVVLGVPHAMHASEAQAVTARARVAVVGPGDETAAADLELSLLQVGVAHVIRVPTEDASVLERPRAA